MPANLDPIYSRIGSIQWTPSVTAANTAMDGTGTVSTIWTADSVNGGLDAATYKLTILATSSAGLVYEDEVAVLVEDV